MTDRIIRDELLTSERYWSVSIEAQRLFIHLILCADDQGRFSGKNYTIRTACFPGQAVQAEKVEKLLAELQDADLIRVYQHDCERFIFIPRFKQRLRYKTSRYPTPPREINDVADEKSDSSPTTVGQQSDHRPPKRREEKRREEKQGAFALPDWVPVEPWKAWMEVRSKNRAPNTPRAQQLAVNELDRLRSLGQDPTAILEKATLNGWRSLWPLKEQQQPVKVDL